MTVYDRKRMFAGFFIYALGDSIATALLQQLLWQRCVGLMLVGGLLYAQEIPRYFAWLDRKFPASPSIKRRMCKALAAELWFNPLWIVRHFALLQLLSGNWSNIIWSELFARACTSFYYAFIPLFIANYGIQNVLPLRWRFVASASLSASMGVYFALAQLFLPVL